MQRLLAALKLPTRRVLGLMSGTSADGVDAALVELRGAGLATEMLSLAGFSAPYPDPLRRRVLAAPRLTARGIAELHAELGEFFARAALDAIAGLGTKPAA